MRSGQTIAAELLQAMLSTQMAMQLLIGGHSGAAILLSLLVVDCMSASQVSCSGISHEKLAWYITVTVQYRKTPQD